LTVSYTNSPEAEKAALGARRGCRGRLVIMLVLNLSR
jgi:hypothetical protein